LAGPIRTSDSLTLAALIVVVVVAAAVVLYFRVSHETQPRGLAGMSAQAAQEHQASQGRDASNLTGTVARSRGSMNPPRDSHEWVHTIVETLAARGDPQSLAAAALLIESNAVDFSGSAANRSRADLTRRAAAASPNDPAIQLLALKACRAVYDCDGTAYENALVAIDAANAWTSGPALRKAVAAGDTTKQAEVLAHMARAQRFDSYLARMESLLNGALQSLRVPAPADADWDGADPASRLVAQTLNATGSGETFGEVSRACKPPLPESIIQSCQSIAKLMLNSDEDMIVRNGLELATTLYPAGSREAARIAELQRRYDWQMYQAIRLPRSPEQNARFVKGRLGDARLRRELLQEHGIALDPPADWLNPFGPSR
jgi:hypothetical protein